MRSGTADAAGCRSMDRGMCDAGCGHLGMKYIPRCRMVNQRGESRGEAHLSISYEPIKHNEQMCFTPTFAPLVNHQAPRDLFHT